MASPDVRAWFARRTHGAPPPFDASALAALVAAKAGRRVGVVLPARDEEATVAAIVRALLDGPLGRSGLVDDVVVVDSHSTDRTAAVAAAAGATVVPAEGGPEDGKGAALATGLRHLRAEVGVFLDADVRRFDPDFVARLVAPLLRDDALVLVKAFYERPTDDGGGGRVTELVARPEIALRAPELAGFVQPLAGECAFVRAAVEDLPVASGYAVDVAMLLQVVRRHGLDATAQADLGRREHGHQDLLALGRMALQVRAGISLVLEGREVVTTERHVPRRDPDGTTRLVAEQVRTRMLPAPGPVEG